MDKKFYLIGVLSVVAAVLLSANVLSLKSADAAFSIKDNRYQLVTTRSTKGGEALYVVDNLTGQVAVMIWENNTIKPIVVQPLTTLFKD